MIDEKLFTLINRLRNYLMRELDSIFRDYKLTSSQFMVLDVLHRHGSLCIKEIQDMILGTNGNVPLVIKNLERDGYISRCKDHCDARCSIISLTEQGSKIINEVCPLQKNKLKSLLQDLDKNLKDKLLADLLDVEQSIVKNK